jgi:hypothetical protein
MRNAPRSSRISIYLELSEGETTTGTDTAVVLDGRASDNGTQLVNRTGSNSSRLGDAGLTTTVLPAGLLFMLVDQVHSCIENFFSSMRVGLRYRSG